MTPRERVQQALSFPADGRRSRIRSSSPRNRTARWPSTSAILSSTREIGNHLGATCPPARWQMGGGRAGPLARRVGRGVEPDCRQRHRRRRPLSPWSPGALDGWEPPAIDLPRRSRPYSSLVGSTRSVPDRHHRLLAFRARVVAAGNGRAAGGHAGPSPDFVHELFERIMECEPGAGRPGGEVQTSTRVHFGDDWGSQAGVIMGPRLWREFIKPCVARKYERVREAGKDVIDPLAAAT